MRRFLSPLLVGLGAFLLIGGVLLKVYAYPKLAVVPLDQNSVTKLEAKGATLFDTTTLKPITTDLAIQNRTVGDVKASEAEGNNVAVWVGTTSIRSSDGQVRSRSTNRTAFDRTSSKAINCCNNFDENTDGKRTPIKRSGLVFKFPFQTDKKTYQMWDSTLNATVPAKYVKETSIGGLKVYDFHIDVPRTKAGTQDVPASLVGEKGTSNVTADSMYSNSEDIWVEPITGAIVDQHQATKNTIAVNGEDKITTTDADIRYTKATVDGNVKDFKSKAMQLNLVHGLLPLLAVIIGLLGLGAGIVVGRRSTGARNAD